MILPQEFHIIPSIRKISDLPLALASPAKYILISGFDISNLQDSVDKIHSLNKVVMVNPELVGGLTTDVTGLRLLKGFFGVDGIVSHSLQQLHMARREGLFCVQRVFLVDSHAWDSAVKALKGSNVDAVEILPGSMALKFAASLKRKGVPMLTGGFIKTQKEVQALCAAGFSGLTTSAKDLWKYIPQNVSPNISQTVSQDTLQ